MRNLALSVAAMLVLAVAAPAFAQPFADVPTDHWAFDAIAELAAKGIIEGFPDGTFKGDRGVSRYEVAIIVARILARIEAIKIPAPAPAAAPQVTRTDVQTIQRLVNEFRAELAALGVRTTAVEEELTALKAATSTIRVSGDNRLRYKVRDTRPGGLPAQATAIEWRNRLMFTAKPGPGVTAFAQVDYTNTAAAPFTDRTTFSSDMRSILVGEYTYVDFPTFGAQWRLGQQDGTVANGLLFGGDPTGGLKSSWSFAGFSVTAAAYSALGDFPVAIGGDYWVARVSTNLGGYNVGATYYSERPAASAGPPTTTSDGYGVDLTGSLIPGVSFLVDYAYFTPQPPLYAAGASSETAWKAQVDLGAMLMPGTTLSAWYKSYGTAGLNKPFEVAGFGGTEIFETFKWNFRGWGAKFTTALGPFSADLRYETGNRVSAGDTVNTYFGSLGYPLAANTSLLLSYRRQDGAGAIAGGKDEVQYRAQVEVKY